MSASPRAPLSRLASGGTRPALRTRTRALASLGAIVVASAVGLAQPSQAPARDELGAGVRGGCQLELEDAPRRITAGETVTLSGTVTCAESSQAAEQTVTIYEHATGTPGSSAVGTAVPEASGAFHFTTEALEGDSSFYARLAHARSARVQVEVAPRITILATPAGGALSIGDRHSAPSGGTGGGTGSTVTFTGSVTPTQAGRRIVLEREGASAEDWYVIAVGHVDTDGTYSITHTFGIPGAADVRVYLQANRALSAGSSETISYQLERGQGPQHESSAKTSPKPPPASPGEPGA